MSILAAPGSRGLQFGRIACAPRVGGMRASSSLKLLVLAVIAALPLAFSGRPGKAEPGNWLQQWTGPAKPSLRLNDLDGRPHDLATYSGKTVIVHFFATWCEPCRVELVGLRRLAENAPADLSIIAVDVAEVPARVRRFLESTPVNFPVLMDADRATTKAWGVSALPTSFVLDPSQVTRLFVEGDVDWAGPQVRAALDVLMSKAPSFNNRTTNGEKQDEAE